MLSEKMIGLGSHSSVIRQLFEYGKKRKSEIGEENVFDFSIGNPSVPAPKAVNDTLASLLESDKDIHCYTSAAGDMSVRAAIASYLNKTYGVNEKAERIYLTVGAAAALTISLGALMCDGDEVIVFAAFVPEYRGFAEKAGAKVLVCPPPADFQIDFETLETLISENTKALIINSPSNPSGAVLTEETLSKLGKLLDERSQSYGHPIYVISDEPYRELVYDGKKTPYTAKFIKNTISCYSFSKSLSLPGERIGYICICSECADGDNLFYGVCGAGRALGYVCAPSLFQKMIPSVIGKTSDLSAYETNRELLYKGLTSLGFEAVYPDGAFYLFVKSPEPDEMQFCKKAEKYELLLVPSGDFGLGGYVRIAYCVSAKVIKDSMPAFEKLAKEYGLSKR